MHMPVIGLTQAQLLVMLMHGLITHLLTTLPGLKDSLQSAGSSSQAS